jgi:hypothetical protein
MKQAASSDGLGHLDKVNDCNLFATLRRLLKVLILLLSFYQETYVAAIGSFGAFTD